MNLLCNKFHGQRGFHFISFSYKIGGRVFSGKMGFRCERIFCCPRKIFYAHAYIHTYIHIYIHACIHTWIHTYIHTCMHAFIHAHTHTHIHTYIRTYIHAYTHRYITLLRWCLLSAPKQLPSKARTSQARASDAPPHRAWAGTSRRPWLVANLATLPQKWLPPPKKRKK